MNKPITTRVNQSSSMGMKVREPMLDVGSVAKQQKEDANKVEQSEGYSLGQDGSVQYGNTTKTTSPDQIVKTTVKGADDSYDGSGGYMDPDKWKKWYNST